MTLTIDVTNDQLQEMIDNRVKVALGKEMRSNGEFVPEKKYIKGIPALAKFLNVSTGTIQAWKNEGVFSFIQYQRTCLFEPDKILEELARYRFKN